MTAKESRPREGTRLAKDTQQTSGPRRLRTAFSGREFLHMGFAPYKTAAGRGRASPIVHSEDKGNPSGVQWCVSTFRDPDSLSWATGNFHPMLQSIFTLPCMRRRKKSSLDRPTCALTTLKPRVEEAKASTVVARLQSKTGYFRVSPHHDDVHPFSNAHVLPAACQEGSGSGP